MNGSNSGVRKNNNFLISILTFVILVIIDVLSFILLSLSVNEFLIIILVSVFMFLVLLFILISTSRRTPVSAAKTSNGKSKMLDIPKYQYVGSTETKKYHKKDCRLAKLIKEKFALYDNNPEFFKSKKFKPCKICLKNQVA